MVKTMVKAPFSTLHTMRTKPYFWWRFLHLPKIGAPKTGKTESPRHQDLLLCSRGGMIQWRSIITSWGEAPKI